jgi:cobalt-zinc-cadmium efflux system membrane fusion protein
VSAGQTLATVESNESLQTYAVTSPLSGVVTQRKTNPGEFAGAEALLEVADFSAVRAELSVFPRDRLRLKVGQKSKIQGADAETLADGVLSYLAPLGSAQNQTITARVALPNREGRWTPGQFVTAEIVVEETRAAVTVVPAAIQQIKGRSVVFIQTEHGFEAREVDIGRRGSDSLEIKNGLRAGERYVSKNSFLVKAEVLKSEAEEE